MSVKRITGVEVCEATAEVETTTGTVVGVFTTGTTQQVYLLAHAVPQETWNGSNRAIGHENGGSACWSCRENTVNP